MKRAIMEFLGTFFLVLVIAVTGNALAVASILMAWVYIGGYISGAHYNPAVSFAAALSGKLTWHQFPRYVIAQIAGALVAFILASNIVGVLQIPAPSAGILQAFIVEVLLAFVLALVVLIVANSEKFKNSSVFGFAIGFTIPALAILGTPISGGLFNPAIAIGANALGLFRGMPVSFEHLIMYVGGALLGGFLAAYAFNYFGLNDRR